MARTIKHWSIALVIAAGLLVVLGWFRSSGAEPAEEAPTFQVETIDGGTFSLAEHRGRRPVVVNFWASWCPPCKAEIPEFVRFASDHPDVAVIGLAVDSGDREEVARFARALGITYPVAVADRATTAAYGVDTLPTTVVIGPDGRVRFARVGVMRYEDLVRATR